MKIAGKTYKADKEELDKLDEAHKSALNLIKRLMPALQEAEKAGFNRTEIASAYFMLAYHALRKNRTKEQADDAWNVLAHFARRRIEHNFEQEWKKKLSRLN